MMGGIELVEFNNPVNLPEELATAYVACVESLIGCAYKPVLFVGTQVVNGINYYLLAEQTVMNAQQTKNLVEVVINIPAGSVGGKGASLVKIAPINL